MISLVGNKQAKLIYDRLLRQLGPEVLDRHRIMCGNASTFQGQERDIVILSMVECPDTNTAKTTRIFEQRFNVPMSRARDRLYLVRSVAPEHLKRTDLKLGIIEHFRSPMDSGSITVSDDILGSCESRFEREVGRRLLDLGYRIRPQVSVGAYRVDFVVEGEMDRRLAIECDGDKYHGADRWAKDVAPQRTLERTGLRFWRCWGSHWRSDPDGCIADLTDTLTLLGIAPLGARHVEHRWTDHRVIGTAEDRRSEGDAAGPAARSQDHTIDSGEQIVPVAPMSPSLDALPTSNAAPSMPTINPRQIVFDLGPVGPSGQSNLALVSSARQQQSPIGQSA